METLTSSLALPLVPFYLRARPSPPAPLRPTGEDSLASTTEVTDGFGHARRPISNPTLFDLALPSTNVHAIAMYQRLPDSVNTVVGSWPMGGDVQVYALQCEIALNERLSIVATKDGYVDIDADTEPLWSDESGFANIAAGLK